MDPGSKLYCKYYEARETIDYGLRDKEEKM